MKPVYVELGGKTRELRYDFKAMIRYEDMVGTGLQQSLGTMGKKTLLAMYTAGLMHEEKGITPQRVMSLLEKEIQKGKTDDDLFTPAIEALYRGGQLNEGIYKMFREAMGDNYDIEGAVPLEELMDEDEDQDEVEDDDEAKN